MRFEVHEDTRYPRSTVFAAHRDHVEDIVRFLPDVEKVELRSRARHAGGREEQTHWWTGSTQALPALLRPVVPPALLQWKQTTLWDPHTWTARWSIEVPGSAQAIVAEGTNTYVEEKGRCRIDVQGDFEFHPERVPQLSKIPASAIPMVEKAVVSIIVPMIERTGGAVAKWLEERGGTLPPR
jgi:hypothetical protein